MNVLTKQHLFTKRLVAFLLLFSFAVSTGWADNKKTVKGRVLDNTGYGLPGVSILMKNSKNGTITDADGNFTITVDGEKAAALILSFIGYTTKEVPVKGEGLLSIVLEEDVHTLDEVVVTALGIKRDKKSLGYATQEVKGENVNVGNDANLLNKLTGKIAGVQITAGNSGAGSSSRVVIRGESSLSNDNQPLYVVDGVPINNYVYSNLAGTPQEIDYGNGAGEVNADDIESISVLKGANAAALYGSRAANGVILITTKSGKTKNRFQIAVNSTTTFENVLRLPKYQNSYSQGLDGNFEYWDGNNGHGTQDHQDMSWGRPLDGSLVPQFDSPSVGADGKTYRGGDVFARNGATVTGTPLIAHPDNVRDFFETGVTYSNNIALSANNEQGDMRLSYTNLYSTGVLPNVDLRRNTISLSAGYKFTDKFSAKANVSYINSASTNRPGMGYGPENPMYTFTWFGRQVDTNSLKDYWQRGYEGTKQFHFNSGWNDNPYFTMHENTNGYDKNRMYGNVVLNYDILKDLTLTARTGIDFFHDLRESKRAYSTQRFLTGAYKRENVFFSEWNTDVLLQWNKAFSEVWRTDLAIGANSMTQHNSYDYSFANGLSVPGVYNLGNASSNVSVIQRDSQKRINSALFTGQLSYKEMIFLNVTARNDWSSSLTRSDGSGNNSYFYPSVSMSAVMSDILKLPEVITYWSIRGGYAEVGSDTEPYRLENSYSYSDPYGSSSGVVLPSTLANTELKPERMRSVEIGTDFRMFNNRVGLDLTYYNTLNTNQIVEIPISYTSGYETRYINAGEIRNYGIEATLSLTPVKTKRGFQWDSNINFSANRSRVEKISEEYDQYVYSWAAIYSDQDARVFAIARQGEAMGNLYGTGFKKTENGETIVDATGLPVADPTLVKLGNYNPDFMLGFYNKFSYKGFSLDFLLDWRQGGVFVSRTFGMGMESGVLDRTENRTPEDMVVDGVVWDDATNGYIKNTKQVSPRDYYRNLYRRYHETESTFSATFVKLREVKVGYSFPASLFAHTAIKGLNLSVVGRNLFMWTKDQSYVDPEAVAYEGASMTPGVEEMSYPSTRSIGFNINLIF